MDPETELVVLGGMALHHDDEDRHLGGPKAQQVLSMLLAHRRHSVSIDRLIDALWPEHPPRSATATLQTQISRLRSLLAPGFTITLDAAGYRLNTVSGLIDADRFEALVVRSRVLDDAASVAALELALGLWHGPAFGSFADTPQVRSEAVRLEELRLVAIDEWATKRIDIGDPAPMIAELESLISLHPLRECYWRLLMLALYRTGRQTEALRRANQFRSILVEESGLDLSPTLRKLEARILTDDPSLIAAPESTYEHRSSLVSVRKLLGVTSFIGRDLDLATLSRAFADHTLITITGPGGVGKTRLALRVAANAIETFDDGVTIVEFAPLRDPAGVAQVIAHALDIQRRQFRTIESTIAEHLAPTSSLLVLDNCEHVTETLAPLVDHLRLICPELRILATSREPLGLPGEYVNVLAPLDLPLPDTERSDEISRFAAVELFVARAATATPGFALTDKNAVAVAEICRRLDGLPLGLELAASRLRTMGIDALARQLQQRTDILSQTQRGADRRQRTLVDLVEWSYELLTPDERAVFEQLSLFSGGFDLSAAEAVCGAGEENMSAVAHLTSLVDKSMVLLVDPLLPRYRLLEPLREFGLDRLRERKMLEATEDRHLRWFRDLAEQGAVGLDDHDEADWSATLDRDFDNFRSAHLTAIRREDVDSAFRIVASLREFAFRRIRYEIISWADSSTSMPGARGHRELPTVLGISAYGRFVQGDMEAAVRLAHDALDDENGMALSTSGLPERALGNALFYMQQTDEALRWMERMLLSARRSGSNGRITHALYMLSVAQTSVGDGIRGAVLAGEARAAAVLTGSPTAHAQADYALGLVLESTDPKEALAHLERSSTVAAAAGNRWIEAFSLTEVHWLQARQGEHLMALVGYRRVVDIWYRGGDWANQWLSLRRVLGILIDLGAYEASAVLHGSLTAKGAAHALPFEPVDAERLAKKIGQLRTLLGPKAVADAIRQGASMSDSEIVTFVKQQIAVLSTTA